MMKEYDVESLRNIALIAHGGAGKTSLAEAILFDSGATSRLGKVADGSSLLDYDADEVKRQISINLGLGFCEWKRHKIYFVDTPGYADFIADAQGALRVVDGAVVPIGADSGVRVQTERIWQTADQYGVPRLIFLNKLDQERASFSQALESVRKAFRQTLVPIQIPFFSEETFKGVIDLIHMKAFLFELDGSGKFVEGDLPDQFQDEAQEFREKLIEGVAETNDELLEKYLEGGELLNDEIESGLRRATLDGKLVPILCGSATENVGVQQLLDAIVTYLPSPKERPPVKGKEPNGEKEIERGVTLSEPFSALIFKTIADPYAGKLTLLRVYSGRLESDSSVYNASKQQRERIGQLYFLQGKNQTPTPSISAGDFAAMAKLKVTTTGDTLCDEKEPVLFEPFHYPEPVISLAIVPKTRGDEEKVSSALARLMEEDPTLRLNRDPQTKEMILSGMGQVHLEVTLDRLKRKFGVDVEMKLPRVPYKETVRSSAKVQGRYKRQSGGRGQFGDAWIELEPLPRGQGFEFVDKIVGGVIPRQYIPAVEKGIVEAMVVGFLAGYPVVDVKATLYDGSYHIVDSSEMAFKIAGSMAFKKAALESNPVLLEPIMSMEIVVPEEYMGDIIGDLNSRRGRVVGMDSKAGGQVIKAHVAMAEVLSYASDLTSITGGRGTFTMEFFQYEEVPSHLAEKIIAEAQAANKT